MKRYESWGRYPHAPHRRVIRIKRDSDLQPGDPGDLMLAFGQGRSYGDTCLNEGGILLDTSSLSRLISFDQTRGLIRCEAGATLASILKFIVPEGWFLPVTPGTKYVSVGGAIAHDVHGKNHHRKGTFGHHVMQLELLRSSGERLICSSSENPELFRATIGGLGLTGLIVWAEFQLIPIKSEFIETEHIPFVDLEEFYALEAASDSQYDYTVGWLDCFGRGGRYRGIFTRGNHAETAATYPRKAGRPLIRVPFDAPPFLLNNLSLRTFNALYFRLQASHTARHRVHYDPFFYPLDAVSGWNRLYGRRGFVQYQCLIPNAQRDALNEILARMARAVMPAFLAVVKVFGDLPPAGMLSFPRPGVTMALDFPFLGAKTLNLLDELDEVTQAAGGAVYPAKDARMSHRSFEKYFPEWQNFARFIDQRFSSSFWRRVTRS